MYEGLSPRAMVAVFLASAALYALVLAGTTHGPFREHFSLTGTQACVAAQDIVRQRLEAPATARFPWCSRMLVRRDGSHDWTVRGTVESKNSKDLPQRDRFEVKFTDRSSSGSLAVHSATIGR